MRRPVSWLLVLLPALFQPAMAQPDYTGSQIRAPEWPDRVLVADMNGNNRRDLIVPAHSPENGRALEVYLQQADARFPARPSREIALSPEIIAFSLADVRPMPGRELLLISNDAVFSRSTMLPDDSGDREKLFDWDFIASAADRQRVFFHPPPEDLTGDGRPDLLLPGREQYGLFAADAGGGYSLRHRFTTENEELAPSDMPDAGGRFSTEIDINRRDGLVVRVIPESNSAFEDFLEDRRDPGASDSLLNLRQRMPGAVTADLNPETGQDIIFTDVGNDLRARVNILSPRSDGTFPDRPQWQGPTDAEGDYRLEELDGDGLMDIVRVVEDGEDWTLSLYLNRGGRFDFSTPDQRMRFSGYDLRYSATDIDGDGRPEFNVTFYTIPASAAIRDTSINRTQLIFGNGESGGDRIFNARPDSRREESFSPDAVRGLSEPINLEADIDGDGRIDALYLRGDGSLAASAIDGDWRIAEDPFWQYVPERTIVGFEVRELNGDGQPDLLLYHSTSITVLVSSP